jgi:D-psicose/D-tagatose/L-ribulose 3-epimerase
VEAFHSVGDALDSFEVTLSIEPVNRSETFSLRTAAEAKRLCGSVGHSRLGVTIDTFYANVKATWFFSDHFCTPKDRL